MSRGLFKLLSANKKTAATGTGIAGLLGYGAATNDSADADVTKATSQDTPIVPAPVAKSEPIKLRQTDTSEVTPEGAGNNLFNTTENQTLFDDFQVWRIDDHKEGTTPYYTNYKVNQDTLVEGATIDDLQVQADDNTNPYKSAEKLAIGLESINQRRQAIYDNTLDDKLYSTPTYQNLVTLRDTLLEKASGGDEASAVLLRNTIQPQLHELEVQGQQLAKIRAENDRFLNIDAAKLKIKEKQLNQEIANFENKHKHDVAQANKLEELDRNPVVKATKEFTGLDTEQAAGLLKTKGSGKSLAVQLALEASASPTGEVNVVNALATDSESINLLANQLGNKLVASGLDMPLAEQSATLYRDALANADEQANKIANSQLLGIIKTYKKDANSLAELSVSNRKDALNRMQGIYKQALSTQVDTIKQQVGNKVALGLLTTTEGVPDKVKAWILNPSSERPSAQEIASTLDLVDSTGITTQLKGLPVSSHSLTNLLRNLYTQGL